MKRKIKLSEEPKTKKPLDGPGSRGVVQNPKGPTSNNTSEDKKTK